MKSLHKRVYKAYYEGFCKGVVEAALVVVRSGCCGILYDRTMTRSRKP